MNQHTKRTIYSILFFLTSFFYFFLAYVGYKNQNINLSKYNKLESVIKDKGIGYRYTSKGRGSKVFFLQLESMPKKLGIYRINKDYHDLLENFAIGDSIRAYFIDNKNKGENVPV